MGIHWWLAVSLHKGPVMQKTFPLNDINTWKHFPRYWPFVQGINLSPANSPHKGQWRGALIFSLICSWINGWVNNHEAGDMRRHCAHYDITVMMWGWADASDYKVRYILLNKILHMAWQLFCKNSNTETILQTEIDNFIVELHIQVVCCPCVWEFALCVWA